MSNFSALPCSNHPSFHPIPSLVHEEGPREAEAGFGGRQLAGEGVRRGEERRGSRVERESEKLRRFEGKSSKLGQRLLITVWGAVPGRGAVPSPRV